MKTKSEVIGRTQPRHSRVLRPGDLNGLDYLDVVDHTLRLYFWDEVPPGIRRENVRIGGGDEIRDIQVVGLRECRPEEAPGGNGLVATLDRSGDGSAYTLCLVSLDEHGQPTDEPFPGLDPRHACLEFHFHIGPVDCDYRQPPIQPQLAAVEHLARQLCGWQVRAVEFDSLLGRTQSMHNWRPTAGRTADLRAGSLLDRLGSPFDEMAHTVDVRRPDSRHAQGRHNLASSGLFVWRLRTHCISRSQAFRLETERELCYTFSPLGLDLPLYTGPGCPAVPCESGCDPALPTPIQRPALADLMSDLYGPDKSLYIWTGVPPQPVPQEAMVMADLSDWQQPTRDEWQAAVDPELGRLLLHPRALPSGAQTVWVRYHYGCSSSLGGSEYERPLAPPGEAVIYRVGEGEGLFDRISEALAQWKNDKPQSAVIEITDSRVYMEAGYVGLEADQVLQIYATTGMRPVIRFQYLGPGQPEAFIVTGDLGSQLSLDGVLVTGQPLRIQGPLAQVTLRHVTLVPGAAGTCLQLRDTSGTSLNVEHCILGSIQIGLEEVEHDPVRVTIRDSIVDAATPDGEALGTFHSHSERLAYAILTAIRSTFLGSVRVHGIDLAENSILDGLVLVARRQEGCMRFCYVMPGSRTPRRYHCQPDLAERAISARYAKAGLSNEERDRAQERERRRVRPDLHSRRYGAPYYARLARACADEIGRGADDRTEMGVFAHLYQPQRAATLQACVRECARDGTVAGLIIAS